MINEMLKGVGLDGVVFLDSLNKLIYGRISTFKDNTKMHMFLESRLNEVAAELGLSCANNCIIEIGAVKLLYAKDKGAYYGVTSTEKVSKEGVVAYEVYEKTNRRGLLIRNETYL